MRFYRWIIKLHITEKEIIWFLIYICISNLKDNFDKGLYTELLIDGTLKQYLLDINENANNKVNLIIKQLAESENINEQLKEHHQIEWVQAMNNIKNRAEEIVLNEIIYV